MDRTFMTRSIQLQGVKRAVGGMLRTKERLSQESLNSRTREYMLVKRLGQLFFERLRGSDAGMQAVKPGCFTG
jgi:hypothetical protein